jgi:exosortase/archaeosortase family protein
MYIILLADINFPPLQEFLAALTTTALQLQKIPATAAGTFITLVDLDSTLRNVQISFDSTGWKSMYALAALVIATPLPDLKRKLHFIVVGLPAVFMLNFLRIWSTLWYSYIYGWQNFDVIHTLLWREGLIAVVLLFWFFWLRDAVKLEKQKRGIKLPRNY